jgi:hypothetical protein
VALDRLQLEVQPVRDRLVRPSLRHQAKDLALPRRQLVEGRVLPRPPEQARDDFGVDDGATRGDTPAAIPGVPFARPSRDGDLALSYATWICPPTCIEPALCPHTRGEKSWSLCADLQEGGAAGEALVFECLHLLFGVGTVPVTALLAAKERVLSGLASGPKRYRVATSSHCHALAATLDIRPPA